MSRVLDFLIQVLEFFKNSLAKPAQASPPPNDIFDKAVSFLIHQLEGTTFVNDPQDHGGATKYGITQATLSSYLGRSVSEPEMMALDEATARAVYKKNYWDHVGLPLVTNEPVATAILCQGANMGPRVAVTFAQMSANHLGCHVAVDGDLGQETAKALNGLTGASFLAEYCQLMKSRYDGIVAVDGSQRKFYPGWMNRLAKISQIT